MHEQKSHKFEDLEIGMTDSYTREVIEEDIVKFAEVSGDTNPVHLDEEYASKTMFKTRIAHGMLTAGFLSTLLGTRLPGNGCIYLSQTLRFRAPVKIGDVVTATVKVTELDERRKRATLSCEAHVGEQCVLDGEARALVPSKDA